MSRIVLPLLSVVVFAVVWQLAAASGIWNQTFVPYPATVRAVSAESGRTTVFVTHSADEAALLGSRIIVLSRRPGQVALDIPAEPGGLETAPIRHRHRPDRCAPRAARRTMTT